MQDPLSLAASALLLVAADPPPPQGGRTAEAGDKMVCKRQARTGTRFKTATCHTQKEWDAIAAQAGQAAHEMIDRPVIPLNGSDQPLKASLSPMFDILPRA